MMYWIFHFIFNALWNKGEQSFRRDAWSEETVREIWASIILRWVLNKVVLWISTGSGFKTVYSEGFCQADDELRRFLTTRSILYERVFYE